MQTFLNSLRLHHPDSPVGPLVTLSGGFTTCIPGENTTAEELVMRADQALYIAKTKGRNQFYSFEMQMSSNDGHASVIAPPPITAPAG